MSVSRSLLARAFPDNPRLRLKIESALDLVDSVSAEAAALKAQLDALVDQASTGTFQPESDVLTDISNIPNDPGAVEMTVGGATVRPIDGADVASLLSRGMAYGLFVGIAGSGITSARPTIPSGAFAIYHDTTLGKPIFWLGTNWVDATGTTV